MWKDVHQLRYLWTVGKEYTPFMDRSTREEMLAGWDKAIDRSMGWVENDEKSHSIGRLTHYHGAKRRSATNWRCVYMCHAFLQMSLIMHTY